jgi:hypothetical protein
MQIKIGIDTKWRKSTSQWIGEVTLDGNGTSRTAKYTGGTEEEARNAAFAAVGYLLLETTFKQ